MARDYGRICTRFWTSKDIRPLSDRGKLLAGYLLTCTHSNSIGAYLLPDAYVADDLGWTSEAVSKAFAELFEKGWAVRFEDGRHLCIVNYLEFNPIENPNVGKSALAALRQLPDDRALLHVLSGLELYAKHFNDGLVDSLETVRERLRNIEPNLTSTNPEPKPKRAARVVSQLPDWIPLEEWKAYVEMRKKIRAPLTDRAVMLAIKDLEKFKAQGHEPGSVLDQSTKKAWRGLFPLKPDDVLIPDGKPDLPKLRQARERLVAMNRPTDKIDRAIAEAEAA